MSEPHSEPVAFVRDQMLPEQEPPIGERGVIKWLRENLFSTPLNAFLTVLAIVIVWWSLSGVVPWSVRGIWRAGSLTECREIRDALYGEGVEAACWAVLTDRWHQLLFGFYPEKFYWRPILSMVIFLVSIAPVLFSGLPRKMLYVTVAAPFVIFFLLWGGSIWGPLAVVLGFVIGWASIRFISPAIGPLGGALLAIILPLIYWLFLAAPVTRMLAAALPIGLTFVDSKEFGGFMLSIVIGISGIILSLPLGILLALGRRSDLFIINKVSVSFIELIRGVPLIVWLFTASLLLNYFLPPGTNFDLMLRVIIMVTLFSSAYIAEVVRGGLAALPSGQYEAANAMGLTYWQSMQLIILPQALKIAIPGIVNTFIGLFKDTTLVVFIGLLDPIGLSNSIRASTDWNGVYWELFIFIGLMFFIACFSMGRYSLFLEKKLQHEHD